MAGDTDMERGFNLFSVGLRQDRGTITPAAARNSPTFFPVWCYSRVTAALLGGGGISALTIVWPAPTDVVALAVMIAYVHLTALL